MAAKILVVVAILSSVGECAGDVVPSRRIKGGTVANIKDFPHSVFLYEIIVDFKGNEIPITCTAFIINSRTAMTAAHCLKDKTRKFLMYAGNILKYKGTVYEITKKVYHASYSPNRPKGFSNDIGLVFTKTPIIFGETVKPALISKTYRSFKYAFVSGWGRIENNVSPVQLRYLAVPFVPTRECEVETGWKVMVGRICAGFAISGRTTASGDSGAGLMVDFQHVAGVVNGGFQKAIGIKIYANISYHYTWIQNELRGHGFDLLLTD